MRSLALVVLSFLAVSLSAANSGDWAQYQSLKANSFTSQTLTAQNYVAMAQTVQRLKRTDIEAWDYNDAAFALINDFKANTNYTAATAKISADKGEVRKADRVSLKQVCAANIVELDQAHGYLVKASEVATKADVKAAIKSNKDFIRWVKSFIK